MKVFIIQIHLQPDFVQDLDAVAQLANKIDVMIKKEIDEFDRKLIYEHKFTETANR